MTLGNANLYLTLGSSFVPSLGQQYVLINNDGADAVSGTFNGLPEGATITVSGYQFQLSYHGGNGNDITLTSTLVPKTWTGAVNGLWSNPGNWVGGVPASGDSVAFPSGAANLTNTNDLAGLSLLNIAFNGCCYTVGGNGVVLTNSLTSVSAGNVLNLPIDVQTNAVSISNVSINGALSGTGPIALGGNGGGVVYLTGSHTYSGTLSTPSSYAYLYLNGATLPSASVTGNNELLLYGNGTLGPVNVGGYFIFSPGPNDGAAGPGILNTGNLTLTGLTQLYMDINGATPGTGYDQINVTGTVTLGNANLYLTLGSSFVPSLGQQYVLVNNDGADAVSGTFNGLPEGATITVSGYQFQLSYHGGNGNDITLTSTLVPKTWTGAVNGLWSNPGNWVGGVPASGDSVAFPSGAANLTNTNDLAGLSLLNIAFNGCCYTVGGNGVVLTNSLTSVSAGNVLNLPIDVQTNAVSISNVSINGALSGTGPIALGGNGGGVVYLTGSHTYSGTLSTPSSYAYLYLNGATLPSASVTGNNELLLYGNGTLGPVNVGGYFIFSPGPNDGAAGPGILNTGNLTLTGLTQLYMDINGATPGTGYDQINVTGTVTLGNANLYLTLGSSFVPSLGQQYVLINNDGADAVSGTFNGLPEGATITLSGYQFQLSYHGGNGNDVVLTSLNGKPASSTALGSSLNPSNPGQSVTFTATVTGSVGTPTGTVTFFDGATTLGTGVLSAGSATYTTSALTIGSHAIVATYGGDSNFGGSASSTLTQVVNKYATSTSVSSGTNPSTFGSPATFTATVTSTSGTPTGTVTFKDGATTLGSAVLSAGSAMYSTSTLAVGPHSITAVYGGDSSFDVSTSAPLTQNVNSATTLPGAPTIGTATAGNAQATVTFTAPASDGGSAITSYTATSSPGAITGSCSAPCTSINVGGLTNGIAYTFTVTATNGVGTGPASGASNSVTPSAPIASNVALASNGGVASASTTYSAGYPASAINDNERAGLNPGNGGYWNDATPNTLPDSVQILFDGSKTIDRVVVYSVQDNYLSPVEPTDSQTFSLYGITTFTVDGWDGANWETLASVSGNTLVKRTVTFAAYTTTQIRINVTGTTDSWSRLTEVEAWGVAAVTLPATTTTLGSAPNPAAVGADVTFTATVTGNTPTGNVNFTDGASTIGGCATQPLSAGQATCVTHALGIGTHSVVAHYLGDGGNAASSSPVLTQTITDASGNTNVALASAGAVASASSTYSAGYPASAINDNERAGLNPGNGGYWNDATPNTLPDSVQILFDGSKTIDRVVVYSVQDNYLSPVEPTDTQTFSLYGITTFSVDGWDGANWVTLASVSGNSLVKRSVSFAAYTTDRIRINITGTTDSWSRLTEVEAWGVAAAMSMSTSLKQGASAAAATISLTSASNSARAGQPVTFTATVSGAPAGGAVTFKDGASTISGCAAVALTGAQAACSTNGLAAGTHSITAIYSGVGKNASSTSSALSITIYPSNTTATGPTVQSLVRTTPSPTMADSVTYALTFNESVTGVGPGNLAVATSGIAGAAVSNISGADSTWTVTVKTGRGTGELRLDIANGSGITDHSGNALVATPFTGETYRVDKGGTVIGTGQGQPVAGFGSAGYALFNEVPLARAPGAIATLADGRILVAGGIACDTARGNDCALQLARYSAAGIPDATFGTNGRVVTAVTGINPEVSALIVNTDGTFYVTGSRSNGASEVLFVAKFTSAGLPLTTFGSNGLASLDSLPIGVSDSGSAIDDSGRILIASTTLVVAPGGNDIFVSRLTDTGTLDSTFGNAGVARFAISATNGGHDHATALAVQSDGKARYRRARDWDEWLRIRLSADATQRRRHARSDLWHERRRYDSLRVLDWQQRRPQSDRRA